MIYRMEWIHSVKAVKWTPTDLHTLHTSPPLSLAWYRHQDRTSVLPPPATLLYNVLHWSLHTLADLLREAVQRIFRQSEKERQHTTKCR